MDGTGGRGGRTDERASEPRSMSYDDGEAGVERDVTGRVGFRGDGGAGAISGADSVPGSGV